MKLKKLLILMISILKSPEENKKTSDNNQQENNSINKISYKEKRLNVLNKIIQEQLNEKEISNLTTREINININYPIESNSIEQLENLKANPQNNKFNEEDIIQNIEITFKKMIEIFYQKGLKTINIFTQIKIKMTINLTNISNNLINWKSQLKEEIKERDELVQSKTKDPLTELNKIIKETINNKITQSLKTFFPTSNT